MTGTIPRLALSYDEAAEAVGVSKAMIRGAIDHGDLAPSYIKSKPVIQVEELQRWLRTLPTERPA